MFASLKLTSIPMIIVCLVSVNSAKVKAKLGPSGMSFDDTTNCSEFSKFGRFHPYSVLHEKWFVFYYWAPPKPATTYVFTFPTANHTKYLKKILDGNTILPVMWSARQILMENHNNETSLLVERGDRGEYWLYPLYKVPRNHKISPRDIRLKQTGDNRILGLMDCVDETLMVMARINDVPPQKRLQEEASRLGYRGRRGKSYLYQGHEWMPIPEDDEKNYWFYKKEQKGSKESSKEINSSEQNSEEVNLEPNKEPEDSKEKKRSDADSQVFNEEELQSRCVKIEPELWDDPKPNPSNRLMSIEELNSLDAVLGTTPSIDAPDSSPNNKQENNLAKELENTQENNKTENYQDSPKMPMPLSDKPESNTQPNEENCAVCYESSHYIQSTSKPYRPENTHSFTNSGNDEPPRTDVPAEPITPKDSNNSDIEMFTTMTPKSLDDLS